MKKFLAFLLAAVMCLALAACHIEINIPDGGKSEGVMTYEEYMAAEVDDEVVIEAYVQAKQSWWDNKVTVYLADEDGAYFVYNMTCSEADNAKLVPGQKIKVTGFKTEWEGEVEIDSGSTFEFENDSTLILGAQDLTDKLGTDEIINYQNAFAAFNGLTVVKYYTEEELADDETLDADLVVFQKGGGGDDLYFKAELNGKVYNFTVEYYLTDSNTDVYKNVLALNAGDLVDIECFLYWYNDMNPHVTSVTVCADA